VDNRADIPTAPGQLSRKLTKPWKNFHDLNIQHVHNKYSKYFCLLLNLHILCSGTKCCENKLWNIFFCFFPIPGKVCISLGNGRNKILEI
jgi:hypothetical protein